MTGTNITTTDWDTTTDRFVVFLDIMGFKDFVARNDHDEVLSMMKKILHTKGRVDSFVNPEFKPEYHGRGLYSTTFSDSIVLFSKDDSIYSLEIISICAGFFVSKALSDSVPMKGAIAYGKITVDRANQIFFGQPIIDAYLLQEDVQYYGITAHNSIDKYIQQKLSSDNNSHPKKIASLYKEVKTHLKYGQINHLNLKWFHYDDSDTTETINSVTQVYNKALNGIKQLTSGQPRKYIDNTLSMIDLLYEDESKKSKK